MLRRFNNFINIPNITTTSTTALVTLRFVCTENPEKATIASVMGPIPYKVKKGKKYYWCSCGESKNQPFCDGSHKKFNEANKTNFTPVEYINKEADDQFVSFCTCKRTKGQPFCDGSHNDLDT